MEAIATSVTMVVMSLVSRVRLGGVSAVVSADVGQLNGIAGDVCIDGNGRFTLPRENSVFDCFWPPGNVHL